MRPGYYIGLMSGTSMDGIDAALIHSNGQRIEAVSTLEAPWPSALKRRLAQLTQNPDKISLQELGEVDHLCGQQFAKAAESLILHSGIARQQIQAIGSHGQTLFHHPRQPAPFSLQIGDPNIIAERTGIPVVADFRRRDMAAGGQGAPLVPAFHQAVFHHQNIKRVILNIGGIANLSIIDPDNPNPRGFDTGPGNCLLDRWCEIHQDTAFDHNGVWASQGAINPQLLQKLLADEFFQSPPPKSTGTEYFSLEWLHRHLSPIGQYKAVDIQATLLQLTVSSISNAIMRWAAEAEEILLCGGGAHNQTLVQDLQKSLSPKKVLRTDQIENGLDPDWIEAMAFAWLAQQTLEHRTGNALFATGARKAVILGAVYPGSPEQARGLKLHGK